MKYTEMTDEQKERAFAEDVLGWYERLDLFSDKSWWMYNKKTLMFQKDFHPLTDLNHAMLGVEKINPDRFHLNRHIKPRINTWICILEIDYLYNEVFADTPNESIVEACLRITTPVLFEDIERGL